MQSFFDRPVAPGQRQTWYPWPYTEALTGTVQLRRGPPQGVLADGAAVRVRVLGQREPGGCAPALEPNRGAAARQRRGSADHDLQRLRGVRGRPLRRPRPGARAPVRLKRSLLRGI